MLIKYIHRIILGCLLILAINFNSKSLKASLYPSLGVQAGSMGVGVNLSQPINRYFNLRFNVNGFYYNYENKIREIKYKANFNWLNFGLLADYHPFSNGFYLTGGAYYNDNAITLKSDIENQTIQIGDIIFDTSYLGKNGLSGKLQFNKVNPYVGIGYASNNMSARGFTLVGEVGVLFTGTPKLTYNVECNNNIAGIDITAICNQLKEATATEKDKIYNKFKNITVYPVIYLGFAYKF